MLLKIRQSSHQYIAFFLRSFICRKATGAELLGPVTALAIWQVLHLLANRITKKD